MKVVIIGSGNVGTVLGRKIVEGGHEIAQVVGRNAQRVKSLSFILNASACYELAEMNRTADLYIIAVSDSSIPIIAQKLRLKDKIVVHTAAAEPKHVLKECSENYGIIYPVQTLRRELQQLPVVPVLVDGNNTETRERIKTFASDWANSVAFATDEERLKLHVAAVIVNNFTNHLFSLTERYCEHEQLNFKMLYPLIEETIKRIKLNKPSMVQTGPAVRNDFNTLEKHLNVLDKHHYLKELYKIISSNIIDFYSNGKQ